MCRRSKPLAQILLLDQGRFAVVVRKLHKRRKSLLSSPFSYQTKNILKRVLSLINLTLLFSIKKAVTWMENLYFPLKMSQCVIVLFAKQFEIPDTINHIYISLAVHKKLKTDFTNFLKCILVYFIYKE